MGSATDPIYVLVSTHTQSPDGTTRNDTFYMTSTLNAYSTQLANNIATPVWKAYQAEATALGFAQPLSSLQATPIAPYIPAGGPVQLRCEIGIGVQALATPLRYHLVTQDTLSTPLFNATGGQVIYNWIDSQLNRLTPVNLYQGVTFT